MIKQSLKMGFLSAILLLAASELSAQETTTDPALSNSSPTTRLENGNMEDFRLLGSHRPCGGTDQHYCLNGGTCIYPQDNTEPFCICPAGFSRNRCHFDHELETLLSRYRYHLAAEHLIAISCAAAILIFSLAFLICCIVRKRCVKSTKLMESNPSEITV
ncbi:pro-neuregulin-2, membrane-bound isoform-like [Dunckerocampus dactyliophorus]|uniref:pro-neuregulin-2, membrane-bound isoform-like n=1 Tax=Dunckerocampus dactyliophorus TaxID=161453 RepID=UPI0024070931|nr:pro-neuregulin-2, membrane-bound isoform-like [Dunckerocampus dactyliophorus]